MSLLPNQVELVARARADLRMGLPVMVGGVIFAAIETVSPQRLKAMAAMGDLVACLSGRRAQTLKARAYDGDVARVAVPRDADARWLRAVADPAGDLSTPMKGPFRSLRGGDAQPWRLAVDLAKSARLLPAVVGVETTSTPAGLTQLRPDGLADLLAAETVLEDVIAATLPMRAGAGYLHVFRPTDGAEEHYGVEIGRPDRAAPVLVRLHSACFTGDVLGSLKCDCGPQLHAAMAQMGTEGAGVLLYLNQEGRGIGLANKMRAYALQDQWFDTVEANHRLGFEDDERDFRIGAAILRDMGIAAVRLLTNNPAKIAMMEAQGITVTERVALRVGKTPQNADYLATKAKRSGHLL
jgi:GTP cyclohydrolase II